MPTVVGTIWPAELASSNFHGRVRRSEATAQRAGTFDLELRARCGNSTRFRSNKKDIRGCAQIQQQVASVPHRAKGGRISIVMIQCIWITAQQ